jgi:dTDP-4-dehydrorhamnose 3,5-epimerase-like enzyme
MKDFFMFKYKTEVSKLPEVKVFTPEPYTDYRGTMWTYWENSMDTPQSKISKFTRSRKNVLRGLHGDNETWKHITTQSYPNDYVDWQDQISVKWNDPMLKIEWPINNPILCGRDK